MQPIEPRLQRRPPIGLPEEPGIAEPGGHHPLGVPGNGPFVFRLCVHHRKERLFQRASLRDDGKVVLVVHERGGQHLGRQPEKGRIEKARDHSRKLHQVRDFVDEGLVLFEGHAAAEAPRMPFEIPCDPVAALRVFQHDEVFLEARLVLVEAAHLDGASGTPARGQEPMAVGERSGMDLLYQRTRGVWRPGHGERHDAPAVQEQEPPNRPPEHELAASIVQRGVPAHLLGKGQVAEHPAKHPRKRVEGTPAALPLQIGQVLAAR